jgi:hypothetical protein
MDDFVLNVRQIAQYPLATAVGTGDLLLLQQTGLGGPYASISPARLIGTALTNGGDIQLQAGAVLSWNGIKATFGFNGAEFEFNSPVVVPDLIVSNAINVSGNPVVTQDQLNAWSAFFLDNTVTSFNNRIGIVQLELNDVLQAGGAPVWNPHFAGQATAPTIWNPTQNDDSIATTAFVQSALCWLLQTSLVASFNGRSGAVVLQTADVNAAYAAGALQGIYPTAPSPALGDAGSRIATTLFVDDSLEDLRSWILNPGGPVLAGYAPLNSPAFTGIPTGPTANPGTTTGQLATTAYVQAAVAASTTGVSSFNTRTGAVVLTQADVTGVGAALTASPTFTGTPSAPTATAGTATTQLATTAFVEAAIGVTSFNTRTGAIVLTLADVTGVGGAPLANPGFTGVPLAPTAAVGTTNTQIATTAFVAAAAAAGVTAFNGRTGSVSLIGADVSAAGGALVASPTFTGVPAAPTAALNTNTTQLATTAFVMAELGAAGGVSSWNGRAGTVTMTAADITGAGGALLTQVGAIGGRLAWVSTTALSYLPYKGSLIRINGALYQIPSTGVVGLANTGVYLNGAAGQALGASTLYYVYCFNNAGVLTADFSTTGHATSATAGNIGTEIKSGDDTRSLIGMIYTDASSHFVDSATNRYVRSWLNARRVQLFNSVNNQIGTTAAAVVGAQGLVWANEALDMTVSSTLTTTAGSAVVLGAQINGTNISTVQNNEAGAATFSAATAASATLPEGTNALAAYISNSAGTTTYTTSVTATIG